MMKIFTMFSILFWGNLLVAVSKLRGITTTIQFIRKVGDLLPSTKGDVGAYSDRIDMLFDRLPFFFIAKKQRCLVRGLLIFFWARRRQLDVRLQFGSKKSKAGFDTHCWIVLGRDILFEVDDVINQYTMLLEYK